MATSATSHAASSYGSSPAAAAHAAASHEAVSHAAAQPSFIERNHFLLRRLHSLTGIVPVGVFLIEHLLTNSAAFGWFGWFNAGPDKFNEDVHWIHNLPFLPMLEIFGIFLPLAFHAGYGIVIALSAQPNSGVYGYGANRRYTLQRATAWITLIFIVVHLLKFRFAHLVGWGPEYMSHALPDKFEITRHGLQQWTPFGMVIPAWITFAFYGVGLAAAVFHFCNGIWTASISWGITIGEKAQQRVGLACCGLAAVLLTWGGASLYAFAVAKPGDAKSHAVEPVPAAIEAAAERAS